MSLLSTLDFVCVPCHFLQSKLQLWRDSVSFPKTRSAMFFFARLLLTDSCICNYLIRCTVSHHVIYVHCEMKAFLKYQANRQIGVCVIASVNAQQMIYNLLLINPSILLSCYNCFWKPINLLFFVDVKISGISAGYTSAKKTHWQEKKKQDLTWEVLDVRQCRLIVEPHWDPVCYQIDRTTAATAASPAAVEISSDAIYICCFVCIIRETRSKLMERYRPRLLRRKRGTMTNLQSLLLCSVAELDVLKARHRHWQDFWNNSVKTSLDYIRKVSKIKPLLNIIASHKGTLNSLNPSIHYLQCLSIPSLTSWVTTIIRTKGYSKVTTSPVGRIPLRVGWFTGVSLTTQQIKDTV